LNRFAVVADEVRNLAGAKNLPTVNLYLKRGYKKVNDKKIGEKVYLTEFEKNKYDID